ncbi:MAG: hypothetical protein F4078_07785 [Acidimicrobiia bacterium]|nr:hypothetical protein [Acidimicrobiia bacterium]
MRRPLLILTLAGALLAASACEVDVGVDVDVAENGSGTVSLGVSFDRAAADALGDLASHLDLDDLALAGWDVTGPAREADNLLWVRAAKRFGSTEELPGVLAEIAGPDVFRGFELRRRTEFAEQTWEVAGQVDPAAALPELIDTVAFNEGLRERIRGAAGDFASGVPLRGLTMRLSIDLPGVLRSGGGDVTWTDLTADSSAETATAVRMTAQEENTTAKTLLLVGLAAAALFVLAVLLNLLGWWYVRRVRKRRASALMAKADSEQIPAVAAAGASAGDQLGAPIPWGPAEREPVGAVGDDVDWDDLSGAEFEDLSNDFEGLAGDFDELPAGDSGASAGDWTASREAGADAVADSGAAIEEADSDKRGEPVAAEAETAKPDEAEYAASETEAETGAETDEPEPEIDSAEPAEAVEEASEPAEPLEAADESGEPELETDDAEPTEADDEPGEAASDEPAEAHDERGETEAEAVDESGEPAAIAASEATAPAAPSSPLKLVVIGGWGVLFEPADPVGELLIPFVQQAGATASPAEIRESYRLATLARIAPDELWEACGLSGTPTWTHGPYTGRMSVRAGAAEFVGALLRRGISVGCITNDVAEWSWRLRAWTGFEAMSPWVVSSDIGIRKPDPGVFEMLRRVSEIPLADCLVIDNNIRTLDAARSLGASTALFGVTAAEAPHENTHPTVSDFSDLLRGG